MTALLPGRRCSLYAVKDRGRSLSRFRPEKLPEPSVFAAQRVDHGSRPDAPGELAQLAIQRTRDEEGTLAPKPRRFPMPFEGSRRIENVNQSKEQGRHEKARSDVRAKSSDRTECERRHPERDVDRLIGLGQEASSREEREFHGTTQEHEQEDCRREIQSGMPPDRSDPVGLELPAPQTHHDGRDDDHGEAR